jgi:hypothetical protein
MRIFSALAVIVFLTFTALSQKPAPCELTIADSPTIRGLKLGMAEEDFRKLLGDPQALILTSYDLRRVKGFENIQAVRFDFYRGRLMRFDITYDETQKWNTPAEFADALTEPLKLPRPSWKLSSLLGEMECKEFSVSIDPGLRKIRLSDKVAQSAMKEEEKQKQKAFKP